MVDSGTQLIEKLKPVNPELESWGQPSVSSYDIFAVVGTRLISGVYVSSPRVGIPPIEDPQSTEALKAREATSDEAPVDYTEVVRPIKSSILDWGGAIYVEGPLDFKTIRERTMAIVAEEKARESNST